VGPSKLLTTTAIAEERAACSLLPTPEQAENRGMAWVIGAFLVCPCHLPLTLGLAATLLTGTAAGVLLRDHSFLAGSVISVVWLAATWRGILYFRSARKYAQSVAAHEETRKSGPISASR
jgi:hypothetical protein